MQYKCLQNNDQSSNFLSKIKAEIEKEVSSKTSSIGGVWSEAKSTALTSSLNEVDTNTSLINLANCLQTTGNPQLLDFENVTVICPKGEKISDISNSITQSIVGNCVQSNAQGVVNVIDIAIKDKQKVSSETAGINPFMFLLLLLIIPIIIFLAIFLPIALRR